MTKVIVNTAALTALCAFIENEYEPGKLKFSTPRVSHAVYYHEKAFYALTNDDPNTDELAVVREIVEEARKRDIALWDTYADDKPEEVGEMSAALISKYAAYCGEVIHRNIDARLHDGIPFDPV